MNDLTAKKFKKILATIFILAFLLRVYFSIVTPLWQFPDEEKHFEFVQYIALNNELPVVKERGYTENFQPPLYHLIAAVIFKLIKNTSLSLKVHTLRLLSVIYGMLTIFFSFKLASLLFPNKKSTIIGVTAFVALLPSNIGINAGITNDNLAIFSIVLMIYMFVKFIIKNFSIKLDMLFGAILGLSLLTRFSAIPFLLSTPLIFIIKYMQTKSLKKVLKSAAIIYSIAMLISGWWFLRNYALYGDLLGLNAFEIVTSKDIINFNFLFFVRMLTWTFATFWATFGRTNNIFLTIGELFSIEAVISFVLIYGFLFILSALSFLKLLTALKSYFKDKGALNRVQKRIFMFFFAYLCILFFSFWSLNMYDFQPQGRYLFPAIPIFAILFVVGFKKAYYQIFHTKNYLFFLLFILSILDVFSLLKVTFYYILLG